MKAVAIRRGVSDFLSILDDRFAYVPADVIVPGMLRVGDLADVAAALAPRRLLLDSLVDCRNRLLTDTELRSRYQGALDAGSVVIRSQAAKPQLAEWLASAL